MSQGLLDIANQRGGFPLMLKTRRDAFDGGENYPLRSISDIETTQKALRVICMWRNRPTSRWSWQSWWSRRHKTALWIGNFNQTLKSRTLVEGYQPCLPAVETV